MFSKKMCTFAFVHLKSIQQNTLIMSNYSFRSMVKKYVTSSFVLVFATVLALIVANSPWGDFYRSVWEMPVSISVGPFNLFSHHGESFSLMDFINDFLMAIFFFSIGLEIKREMLVGELSSLKKALLPIIGACGGMLVPVLVFCLFCPSDPDMMRGMAIPMATDIAFSLGVLSAFGNRVPTGLKVFLAALAVADDLGGIIVIALFYSSAIHWDYFCGALGAMLILLLGNYWRMRAKTFYIGVGIVTWYLLLNSGIHATIAGVIVAFCVPTSLSHGTAYYIERIRESIKRFPIIRVSRKHPKPILLSHQDISVLKSIESASDHLISPLQDLEDGLRRPINYFIIPIFAFANAGIDFTNMTPSSLFSGIGLSVFMGLLLGKVIGVFSFSWLAIRSGVVSMPAGANWRSFGSVCMLCGIGFTVSMFIADLSYTDLGALGSELLNDAKLGILCGSILSGLIGYGLLRRYLPASGVPEETE